MTFIRRFAAYGQSATQTAKMLSAIVSCAIGTFDMWNKGWDKIFEENEWGKYPPLELVRFIARTHYQAPDRKAVKILEIGCGPGANLLYLAKEGFSAYGIDGSKVALGRAEQRLLQEGLNVALQQGDVMALPYDDASFDSVIDIECLYANSLADTKKIISEIHRVLRPGGSFFSITYMDGLSGEETATYLEGEPHTFTSFPDGPLHKEYGISRVTPEESINSLYDKFSSIEYDYVVRSDLNRSKVLKEWLITCRKSESI
jgi:SAM-dependent methyltransferase